MYEYQYHHVDDVMEGETQQNTGKDARLLLTGVLCMNQRCRKNTYWVVCAVGSIECTLIACKSVQGRLFLICKRNYGASCGKVQRDPGELNDR